MKCLGMLLEDTTDGSGRVTILDLGGEWIRHKIFLCQFCVLDQGNTNNFLKDRRNRGHVDIVDVECRVGRKVLRDPGEANKCNVHLVSRVKNL